MIRYGNLVGQQQVSMQAQQLAWQSKPIPGFCVHILHMGRNVECACNKPRLPPSNPWRSYGSPWKWNARARA